MIKKEFTIQTRVSAKGKKMGVKNGKLVFTGIKFEQSDKSKFKELFESWKLFKEAGQFVSQRVNIPEGLTEGLVSKDLEGVYWYESYDQKKSKYPTTKFDCYSSKDNKIVEVKACSIMPDLTSWSPKPYFDVLYFVDFSSMDGKYDIYKINTTNEEIAKESVTPGGETFQEQINSNRRPRFSLFEKYVEQKYKCSGSPIFSGDLFA